MLVDSHAHLDDSAYAEDLTAVIQRAKENGVSRIINIGADMDSSAKSLELSEKYEQIYAAVGIHPQDVVNAKAKDYDQLAAWLKLPKVVALGEIGLDYYYDDGAPRELQRKIFIEQIQKRGNGYHYVEDIFADTLHKCKIENINSHTALNLIKISPKVLLQLNIYINQGFIYYDQKIGKQDPNFQIIILFPKG